MSPPGAQLTERPSQRALLRSPRPWPSPSSHDRGRWPGWRPYLVENADDHRVEEPKGCHPNEAQEEQVGIPVELEIGRLGIQDGADQLPFRGAEACQEGEERTGQQRRLTTARKPPWAERSRRRKPPGQEEGGREGRRRRFTGSAAAQPHWEASQTVLLKTDTRLPSSGRNEDTPPSTCKTHKLNLGVHFHGCPPSWWEPPWIRSSGQ